MSDLLVEVKNLSKVFHAGGLIGGSKLAAVDNISFALEATPPCILSIVGESGSGKTTLARMLLRLVEPTAGEILISGRNIFHRDGNWTDRDLRTALQPIFQNPFEAFSTLKTVDTYLYETAINLKIARRRSEAEPLIADVLKSMGLDLERVKGKYPYQFSGGELQRISVARAMIPHPKLIVADEPVSMVDASLRMNLVNLFLELKEKYKVSFIYITHDLSTAYYVSDFIAIMFRGSIVEYGPSNLVLTAPLHPYTELLMEAVPQVGVKWSSDIELPDLENIEYGAIGCKFAGRCRYTQEICRHERPPLVEQTDGRSALCYKLVNYRRNV
jgi:peptide/nickel transport system ATP-binding protein